VICDGKFSSELLNDGLSRDVALDVVSLLVSSWKSPVVVSAFADMLEGWLSRSTPPEAISYFCASMSRLLLSSHVAVESLHFSPGDRVLIISESDKGSIAWHRNRQCGPQNPSPTSSLAAEAAQNEDVSVWKGDSSTTDLSAFSSSGQIRFHRFSTVRGPAIHRHQSRGSFEINLFRAVMPHSLAFAPLVSHLFQVTHQMVVEMMKTHGDGMVNASGSGRMGHMACRK